METIFNVNDQSSQLYYATWAVANESPKIFRPEQDSNPDLCDAGAVLHQLSDQANWELVIMWVYDKPVDSGYMRFN